MPRSCGDCSLCCKLLGVTELEKPGGKWCEHWSKGKGCKIYGDRPHSCRVFGCGWLVSEAFPDYWQPMKSKMVIGFNADTDRHVLQIYVDPSNRNGWEREPYRSDIERLAIAGQGKYETEIRLFAPDAVIQVKA